MKKPSLTQYLVQRQQMKPKKQQKEYQEMTLSLLMQHVQVFLLWETVKMFMLVISLSRIHQTIQLIFLIQEI